MATNTSPIVLETLVKQLYFEGKLTNKAICKKTGIKPSALSKLIKIGDWKIKRSEIERDMIELANSDFRKHVAINRIKVAKRHNDIARLIEEDVRKRFEEAHQEPDFKNGVLGSVPISARDLKDLSHALKNAADISARAVILSEKLAENNQQAIEAPKAMQLINVNINPVDVPMEATAKIIDITEQKHSAEQKTQDLNDPEPF
jgi:hypothetical protein